MDNTDCETGESIPNTHHGDDMSMANLFDSETGEMDGCPTETLILMRKTRFSVPKELIKAPANKSNCCMDSHDTFTLSKKEEVINLQEVNSDVHCPMSIYGSNNNALAISGNHSRLQQNQSSFVPLSIVSALHQHMGTVDVHR